MCMAPQSQRCRGVQLQPLYRCRALIGCDGLLLASGNTGSMHTVFLAIKLVLECQHLHDNAITGFTYAADILSLRIK